MENGRKRFALGVDFGGTNTKLALVDKTGRILAEGVFATSECPNPTAFAKRLAQETAVLLQKSGTDKRAIRGMGMGLPGLIDHARGVVHTLVNVKGWDGLEASAFIERHVKLPVLLENDVNAMALGELRFGSAKGYRDVVCVTLGTGVGGGIIIEGNLYRGASLTAGEIGHIVVASQGPRCNCGSRGCLEALVGTQGLLRHARNLLKTARNGVLANMVAEARGALTPHMLSLAAKKGDKTALRVWNEAAGHLGIVFAGVANLLNPELIVLGGGVSAAGDFFIKRIRKTMRQTAMAVPAKALKIVPSRLGNRGGMLGAASLVWERER